MTISLTQLVSKSKKELNAMKKEDMIASISCYGFQLTDAIKKVDELNKNINLMNQPNNNLILLMLGFLGIQPEVDEYSKKPILTGYSVDNLIGQVIAKAIKERHQ